MDENFLLQTETAVKLFQLCKDEPLLTGTAIYPPRRYTRISSPRILLSFGWAATITNGGQCAATAHKRGYITGNKSGYEKFKAWAKVMPSLIGNPLYHWTHLELQRFFDIYTPFLRPQPMKSGKRQTPKSQRAVLDPRPYYPLQCKERFHHRRPRRQP